MNKPIHQNDFEKLQLEIRLKAKGGVDFVFAAAIVWAGISVIWYLLANTSYEKSVFTFIFGSLLIPLAIMFSKLFKTNWKIEGNPLQPLGLWLNFAQLIYFPFLIFIFLRYPDYFIMAYAIITGAHLFPYAWYYKEMGYAVSAVLISVGAMLLALNCGVGYIYYIPMLTMVVLLGLGMRIAIGNRKMIKLNAE